jgi:hypothetical protein
MATQVLDFKMLEIENTMAARILADPEVAVLLKPFMRGALTVKGAADQLGLSIQTMHYRVGQFEQAGLLEVVGLEARRGRPIKHYQATARGFSVPLKLIPDSLMAALSDHVSWKQQLERGLAGLPEPGKYHKQMVVFLDDDGLLNWGSDPGDDPYPAILNDSFPPVFNKWTGGLRLNRTDAKALQRELWELYERYAHRGGEGRYVLHLGLAPTAE